ncbi:LOW QUALITY PROTEIN: hypothetical protein BU14_0328s0033 [Porphyra umbilicalis]|uniref:Uncharacterized protein n=1 Tax=Porphyra umbilicalis TaxID=2786 RepID=A0A1X6NYT1_PORUM|nr:LOW QUALITY PROTEIN: hypothetical protein BU14_0328s0033 [Porphyra umbilicalis]|eukprot:OSX73781.1 LOW QUALITY PROTEIN: hypothetical protein BU14_0328s0033 [Porphyra umbilicalis]
MAWSAPWCGTRPNATGAAGRPPARGRRKTQQRLGALSPDTSAIGSGWPLASAWVVAAGSRGGRKRTSSRPSTRRLRGCRPAPRPSGGENAASPVAALLHLAHGRRGRHRGRGGGVEGACRGPSATAPRPRRPQARRWPQTGASTAAPAAWPPRPAAGRPPRPVGAGAADAASNSRRNRRGTTHDGARGVPSGGSPATAAAADTFMEQRWGSFGRTATKAVPAVAHAWASPSPPAEGGAGGRAATPPLSPPPKATSRPTTAARKAAWKRRHVAAAAAAAAHPSAVTRWSSALSLSSSKLPHGSAPCAAAAPWSRCRHTARRAAAGSRPSVGAVDAAAEAWAAAPPGRRRLTAGGSVSSLSPPRAAAVPPVPAAAVAAPRRSPRPPSPRRPPVDRAIGAARPTYESGKTQQTADGAFGERTKRAEGTHLASAAAGTCSLVRKQDPECRHLWLAHAPDWRSLGPVFCANGRTLSVETVMSVSPFRDVAVGMRVVFVASVSDVTTTHGMFRPCRCGLYSVGVGCGTWDRKAGGWRRVWSKEGALTGGSDAIPCGTLTARGSYSRSPKIPHCNCPESVPIRPLRSRRDRFGTLVQQLDCAGVTSLARGGDSDGDRGDDGSASVGYCKTAANSCFNEKLLNTTSNVSSPSAAHSWPVFPTNCSSRTLSKSTEPSESHLSFDESFVMAVCRRSAPPRPAAPRCAAPRPTESPAAALRHRSPPTSRLPSYK